VKIAIIGTRGIPNNYGGFEQFAQYLSLDLVKHGFDVWVYNSHNHPHKEKIWNGVNIIHCYDPEDTIGTVGQFIYDFNCIRDCRKRGFDIILQLGYTSNSIWHRMLPKIPKIVTNMDGLEWKRTKYSPMVRRFLMYAEKLAVISSDVLIADSKPIQEHLQSKYKRESVFIPYGTFQFENPDITILSKYGVEAGKYFMCIARMQSDNHIEEIIKGVNMSRSTYPLLIFGSTKNRYGKKLRKKYSSQTIRFMESEYDIEILNNLRYFCYGYFHGHSAGGTNPSLLEAMASYSMICAHNNVFNKSVLEKNAIYFDTPQDIASHINNDRFTIDKEKFVNKNYLKTRELYNHQNISKKYINTFETIV